MPRKAAREVPDATGTDLLYLRVARRYTLKDVQAAGGPALSYLAAVERGVQSAGEWTLHKLAAVYELDVEEIRRAYSVTAQRAWAKSPK